MPQKTHAVITMAMMMMMIVNLQSSVHVHGKIMLTEHEEVKGRALKHVNINGDFECRVIPHRYGIGGIIHQYQCPSINAHLSNVVNAAVPQKYTLFFFLPPPPHPNNNKYDSHIIKMTVQILDYFIS